MALDKAHEGYEYQDLLTAYFIQKEILDETESEFIIDRKEFGDDKIDDLLIRNEKGIFKRQIKYSGDTTNHTFVKANISADSTYNLSLDSLYQGWLKYPERNSTEFRLCLAWNEPVDELVNVLEPVHGLQTFPDFSTKVFKIKGSTIWPNEQPPLSSWRQLRKASVSIDRVSFLKFCDQLLIEVALPKFSLNLNRPGYLEKLVLAQATTLGVGIFPNNHLRPEDFILHLLAIIKRARSKGNKITGAAIFHELNIKMDYGKIEQNFPVIERENLHQKQAVEEFIKAIAPFHKVILTGEPGSGKSWFIENLQKVLRQKGIKVIRHYCYTHLDDILQQERIKSNTFFGNLIYDIIQAYPKLKVLKQKKYASNLSELNLLLENIQEPTYLIVDGLDHIERIFHFRQFTDIAISDIAIIENIQKLKISSNVKIIVASQNIPQLEKFTDFHKNFISAWTEADIKFFLKKLRVKNDVVKSGVLLSAFLLERSSGNPLYIKYLLDEIKRHPANIQQFPPYSFNLELYYQYLTSQLNAREDVAQVLSGVNFSLTKAELEEITGSGNYVSTSLDILSPVLKPNFSLSGYIIYHESFRRYIIEQLKTNSVSVERKVFLPIIEWFGSKDFFTHRKTYKYSLSFLFESGKFKEMLNQLNYTFVTESIVNGQSWELIERNYKYFVKAACNLKDFESVVLLNEIDKILSTTKESFLQLFSLYVEALGKTMGFQFVSEYLVFEGAPSFSIEEGLKTCYICDENRVAAPWQLYLESLPKKISKELFPFYVRGLLALKKETALNSLSMQLQTRSREDFSEIFRKEFLKYNPKEYTADLVQKHSALRTLIVEQPTEDLSDKNELLLMAEKILKFENVFTSEAIVLQNFFSSLKSVIDEEFSIQLIEKFKGKNWFYNWIIYYIKIILLKKNSSLSYFKVKEAFDYLQYTTEPFRGKPRTCDLYSVHPFIYNSFQEALQLIVSPEQWKEIIDILVVVSNGTTTSLQRSIGGPLATDALFKLLSEFANENNRSHINEVFEAIVKEKEEYHLHSNIAEYNFRLASLFGSANEKDKALSYFRNAIEYILGYTMRKDLTLVDVIHGVKYYALVQPEKALEDLKKTRVLVDSAVEHTDGKETHHFPVMWFEKFLEIDFQKAALFLLHELSTSRYDWRAEKSLIDLLCAANGKVNPVTEFYLASTFPLNDSEKFINYCLNLHEILQPLNPSFAEKLMARIIPFAQPRQNKSLSEKVIDRVNEKIENSGYSKKLQVPKPEKYRTLSQRKWYIENIIERKEFSSMSDVELMGYFQEKGIQQEDALPLTYLFSQFDELTEARKQIIQTIVTKNNRNYSDKIDIDIIFETQNEIECYYWICRFVYDVGGWFEKFVNDAAFQKAHAIAPTKALDYLFELLPSQLDIVFNFEFSSNLMKALIKVGYDRAVISSMWNNLFKITSYRLPVKEEMEWNSILGNELEMDTEEILISIMICRYKAATTERFQWTTSALNYFFEHKQDKLIKPLKWFFSHRTTFLDSVLAIILQLLLKQKERGNLYHLNFETELRSIFPKHYFLIDYLISKLLNISLPRLEAPDGLIYPSMKDEDYDFFIRLNRRFRPIASYGINLEEVFSKYVASIRNKYGEYFKLYWNRAYEQGVPNVYTSDYLLQLVNRELYREFVKWGEVENEVVFKYASLIDIDAIISHINSFDLRPDDLPKPYELDKHYFKISNFERGEWIRLGHYEIALKNEGVRRGGNFKSFGGIVFSNDNSNIFPYSDYSIFPFHIWSDINPEFELDKTIVFALLQEDSLEFFKLLWLNPTLVKLLELTVKNTHAGLIGVNSIDETILKMRTWSCDYIGDDYQSSLSDEIPRLQGTDLIIREDYLSKLSNYFTEVPTYRIVKWELPKK